MDNRIIGMLMRLGGGPGAFSALNRARNSGGPAFGSRINTRSEEFDGKVTIGDYSSLKKRMRRFRRFGGAAEPTMAARARHIHPRRLRSRGLQGATVFVGDMPAKLQNLKLPGG
jgi:hypothetical protein